MPLLRNVPFEQIFGPSRSFKEQFAACTSLQVYKFPPLVLKELTSETQALFILTTLELRM